MNIILTEKYRPKNYEEVLGFNEIDKIKDIVKDINSMPNLLLHGPPGIGKTTLAKIIIKQLEPVEVLKINGSSEAGIDFVRDKLVPFLSSKSSVDKKKIVFFDEFDGVTANAFKALRETIEKYYTNVVFICTCNYINKIPEPVQSRFSTFEFKKVKKEVIIERLKYIIKAENIVIENESILDSIYVKSKGDIRRAINYLCQLGNNIKVNDIVNLKSDSSEVLNLIIAKNYDTLRREKVFEINDLEQCLVDMDESLFNSPLEQSKKIECNNIIAQGLFEMSFVFNKEIQFVSICSKLMKVI